MKKTYLLKTEDGEVLEVVYGAPKAAQKQLRRLHEAGVQVVLVKASRADLRALEEVEV